MRPTHHDFSLIQNNVKMYKPKTDYEANAHYISVCSYFKIL